MAGQFGAGDGTQTRGLILGKDALYQLSYSRVTDLILPKLSFCVITNML